MRKIRLVIIDPQVDFMDLPGSALPVPGADADMKRLASFIRKYGKRLESIAVTLDSHRKLDIAHPKFWVDANGTHPAPFTIISADDIRAGIWAPRNAHYKLPELGGKTLGEYAVWYCEQLAATGQYLLIIWPEHCLIGTPGHNVHPELMAALMEWEVENFASVDYVVKGDNPFTEHFGGLMAAVPLASDPSTALNTNFLELLADSDDVLVAGEALSHCVLTTVSQVAENIGDEHISKFNLLTDCMSPVPQVGSGPDFPAISNAWLQDMSKRGMKLVTTDTLFK